MQFHSPCTLQPDLNNYSPEMMQVVEEKVELIKEESPWKEEIDQLSNKKSIENLKRNPSGLGQLTSRSFSFSSLDSAIFQKISELNQILPSFMLFKDGAISTNWTGLSKDLVRAISQD